MTTVRRYTYSNAIDWARALEYGKSNMLNENSKCHEANRSHSQWNRFHSSRITDVRQLALRTMLNIVSIESANANTIENIITFPLRDTVIYTPTDTNRRKRDGQSVRNRVEAIKKPCENGTRWDPRIDKTKHSCCYKQKFDVNWNGFKKNHKIVLCKCIRYVYT